MKRIIFLFVLILLTVPLASAQKKRGAVAAEKLDCQPKLSTATVREFLRGKTLKEISSSDSDGEEKDWVFSPDELIELDIIETKITNEKAVSVVNIKSSLRAGVIQRGESGELENFLEINGRLRLNFELVAGEWELLKIENLSVKYSEFESQIVDN